MAKKKPTDAKLDYPILKAKWEEMGCWDAVESFMQSVRKGCEESGMDPCDCEMATWAEAERNFPLMKAKTKAKATPVGVDDQFLTRKSRSKLSGIPASWGVLPKSVKFEDEVDWVYAHYIQIVEESTRGKVRLNLQRASPAPSQAAVGLARWAMDNRKAFYEQMVPRAKKSNTEDEIECVRREKVAIAEIRSILEAMRDKLRKENEG